MQEYWMKVYSPLFFFFFFFCFLYFIFNKWKPKATDRSQGITHKLANSFLRFVKRFKIFLSSLIHSKCPEIPLFCCCSCLVLFCFILLCFYCFRFVVVVFFLFFFLSFFFFVGGYCLQREKRAKKREKERGKSEKEREL